MWGPARAEGGHSSIRHPLPTTRHPTLMTHSQTPAIPVDYFVKHPSHSFMDSQVAHPWFFHPFFIHFFFNFVQLFFILSAKLLIAC